MPQFQQVTLGQNPLGTGLRLLPWGLAPFLLAPRAGVLADKIGERSLAVAGLLLQVIGMAWIAAVAAPGIGYPALIAPMSIAGVGFAIAIPAVTRAVTSTVPPADIGKASGAYATMRQLGGAFGVAIPAAAFAATGSYASPTTFSDGFVTTFGVAAGIALAGAVTGAVLPGRNKRQAPWESHKPARPPSAAGTLAGTAPVRQPRHFQPRPAAGHTSPPTP
jgi:MFS family permease